MPGRPPLTVRLLALALLLGATGCSSSDEPEPQASPVDVPVPSVSEAVRASCAGLMASLPVEIDPGVERRPVAGDEQLTAAWGEPPVTLECGVPAPDRPDEPVTVNGVRWSVRDIGPGYRWTTDGLSTHVAVQIPDHYANGAELVNPLAEPLQAAFGE